LIRSIAKIVKSVICNTESSAMVEDDHLNLRAIVVAKRMKWFEENIYDIRRSEFAKDLSKYKVLFDLQSGYFTLNEKLINELESIATVLEEKYKPEDAFMFE